MVTSALFRGRSGIHMEKTRKRTKTARKLFSFCSEGLSEPVHTRFWPIRSLRQESNRCSRVFDMNQLTSCALKNLIPQFLDDFLSRNKQTAVFVRKTVIFMSCKCYHLVNWTEDFLQKKESQSFSKSNYSCFLNFRNGKFFDSGHKHGEYHRKSFWAKIWWA